ncbi:MAG: response regulator [Elusimicrobia bacterium]|nr:response regulator [Elusimicrobiota bacterium]
MKKILVVDGEGDPFSALATLLKQEGFEVEFISDKPSILEKLKIWHPDLVIADIFSRKINGAELLESIRKDPHVGTVPILILSSPEGIDLVTGQSPLVREYLTKPLDFDQLQRILGETAGPSSPKQKPKVLLADDDLEFIDLVSMYLENHHYTPIPVTLGNKVAEQAKKEKPSLILLDLSLPGIDGFAILEQLKKEPLTSPIPVVVLSALRLNTYQPNGLLTGDAELIAKSIPKDFLINLIRVRLSENKPPPSAQTSKPKILVADDQATLLTLMKEVLEEAGFAVTTAGDGQEAIDKIRQAPPDIAVLDLDMPRKTGLEVCQELKKDPVCSSIPMIILTGISEKKTMLRGLGLGIDEYLVKPVDTDELIARIQMILNRTKQVLDANPLTRLPGNPSIQSRIEQMIAQNVPLAVLYIDLNQFKAYNDAYGFEAGDRVIKTTGNLLVEMAREADGDQAFVGHIGGDDFILITHPDKAEILCQKIIKKFDEGVASFYHDSDRRRGYIVSTDRKGNIQKFPLLAIAIGTAHNKIRKLTSFAEISHIGTELKNQAKKFIGSQYIIDRRKD